MSEEPQAKTINAEIGSRSVNILSIIKILANTFFKKRRELFVVFARIRNQSKNNYYIEKLKFNLNSSDMKSSWIKIYPSSDLNA
jgi:hypothetical protein